VAIHAPVVNVVNVKVAIDVLDIADVAIDAVDCATASRGQHGPGPCPGPGPGHGLFAPAHAMILPRLHGGMYQLSNLIIEIILLFDEILFQYPVHSFRECLNPTAINVNVMCVRWYPHDQFVRRTSVPHDFQLFGMHGRNGRVVMRSPLIVV
jgi:hypothetical protein